MNIQFESNQLVIFESALFRTTSCLIIDPNYLLLVDPNYLPAELDFIQNYIASKFDSRKRILYFTHSDYDHIVGFSKFSAWETIASKSFTVNPAQASNISKIQEFDDEHYILRKEKVLYPRIDHLLTNFPSCLEKSMSDFTFYDGRGHNSDGILAFSKVKGTLIVGDYLSNIEFPFIYDSLDRYRNTLDTIRNITSNNDMQYVVVGHGDLISSREELDKRMAESRNYLDLLESLVNENGYEGLDNILLNYTFKNTLAKSHKSNIEFLRSKITP